MLSAASKPPAPAPKPRCCRPVRQFADGCRPSGCNASMMSASGNEQTAGGRSVWIVGDPEKGARAATHRYHRSDCYVLDQVGNRGRTQKPPSLRSRRSMRRVRSAVPASARRSPRVGPQGETLRARRASSPGTRWTWRMSTRGGCQRTASPPTTRHPRARSLRGRLSESPIRTSHVPRPEVRCEPLRQAGALMGFPPSYLSRARP